MYCPKCGTKLPDDAVFCMKCGRQLARSEFPESPPEVCTISLSGDKPTLLQKVLARATTIDDFSATCWWIANREDGSVLARSNSFPGRYDDGLFGGHHYNSAQEASAVNARTGLMRRLQKEGWEYVTDPETGVPSTKRMIRKRGQ
jgi:hypothetical protein